MSKPDGSFGELFDLAGLALRVLAAQRLYFDSRKPVDLEASKRLEKKLRESAQAVIQRGTETRSMFDCSGRGMSLPD